MDCSNRLSARLIRIPGGIMQRRTGVRQTASLALIIALVATGCSQQKTETVSPSLGGQGKVSPKLTSAPGTLAVFAGVAGGAGSADGAGAVARFYNPGGVTVDGSGNVYVADTYNNTIRKVTPAGVVTTLAGTAGVGGSADGTGAAARFSTPYGVAVDGSGNVYVADTNNSTIRKITPAGVVSTLAGNAGAWGSADGTGAGARFNYPQGVAVDGSGNVYVADSNNYTIRKITPTGVVTTLAGTAGAYGSADGAGAAARFINPFGVAVDGSGTVYVADTGNLTIRKITPAGVVTTLAGSAGASGTADGTGVAARFYQPFGVAVDGSGNVYVADTSNFTIRKITPAGVVTTFAGAAGSNGSADGTGAAARFWNPRGVAVDGSGNIFVADTNNSIIRKITPAGVVTTPAGTASTRGSADGTGAAARFNTPWGVAVDGSGTVYVADSVNSTIRKITPAGVVTTLAGTANQGGSVDGTGAAARFSIPNGVAVDGSGNVFVADTGNFTIRKITPVGAVATLAGTVGVGGSADGTGAAARFFFPYGIAVDGSGGVYVADTYNHTIRKITPAGVVTTLAGTAGASGSADGTGAAARFNNPYGIAVDGSGNVYVADTYNHTIRKINPAGVVTTIAGAAGSNGSADGTGAAAHFLYPRGVAVDGSGTVYVADTSNSTIRKITPASVVTTLVGVPSSVQVGNVTGPLPASLVPPFGVAVDPATGSLYISVDSAVLVASNSAPLAIGPATATVDPAFQRTFSASGGTPPYSWSLSANNSGGSITSAGVYTAGGTGSVTDIVTVTDSLAATASATITVPAQLTITNGFGGNVDAAADGQLTLTASGGTGPYTWTMTTNGSGGSVTPGGIYTAGPNGGTDTITVTDANGGTSTVTITVTVTPPAGGEAHGAPALGGGHVEIAAAMLALLGLALAGPRGRTRRR
jgi:streptogramin lyase